jgi:hypothetical protein
VKDISSLLITKNTQYVENVTTQPPHFEIKHLPKNCINRPNIKDLSMHKVPTRVHPWGVNLIVYKVPTRVHPWGVNLIVVIPKNWDCNFKDFSLCVRKVDWMLHTYVVIGSWCILVTLDGRIV